MLTKQGWRLITKPDSLVAQVLKAKYYPTSSFLEARIGRLPSLTWRSIWSSRGLLKKGICWRVGNGLSIRVLCDVLLSGLPAEKVIPLSGRINYIARVTEFLDLHTMQWKENFMRETLPATTVDRILCIPLPSVPITDTVAWQYSNTGIYTVSSGYHVFNGSHRLQANTGNLSTSTEDAKFYKKLWDVKLPPKVLLAVWRVYKGYNYTMQKLYDRYVVVSPVCPRCSTANESSIHTFRDCDSFNQVWNLLQMSWSDEHNYESMQQWLRYMLDTNNARNIQKILLVLWANWTNRNKLIHEGVVVTHVQLAFYVEKYMLTFKNAIATPIVNHATHTLEHRWKPPPQGFVTVNFDASFEKQNQYSYSRVIIQDYNGMVKVVASIKLTRITSPFEAEVMACLHALQLAWSFDFQKIVVEGDSKAVVNRVCSDDSDRSPIASIVTSCKILLSDFTEARIRHIRREINTCAYALAKNRR